MFGRQSGETPAKRFLGLFGIGSAAEEEQKPRTPTPDKTAPQTPKDPSSQQDPINDIINGKPETAEEKTSESSASEQPAQQDTPAEETPQTEPDTAEKLTDEQPEEAPKPTGNDSGETGEAEEDPAERQDQQGQANEDQHDEDPTSEEDRQLESFQLWLDSLSTGNEQDTMLRFAPSELNSIDLTHVHPSGLTQFMVGRKTRLSTLLRDPEDFATAQRAARLIRSKVNELEEERGISVGYLACGLVTWRTISPDAEGNLRSVHLSAPALLARVSIHIRPEQDDYELHIQERAQVNPALIRRLKQRENLEIDTEKVVRAAYATAKLDPLPAMDELRSQLSELRSVVVENKLLISTFADLSEAHDGHELNRDHPMIAALHRGGDATEALLTNQPENTLPPLDERDPETEYLVLDADSSQQAVLDKIHVGQHVLVDAAPGTGAVQTAANAAATLAAAGKSVLVVAERRAGLDKVLEEFERVELASAVLDLQEATDDGRLRHRLVEAILRNERATQPNMESIHRTLKRTRHQLIDHVKSLHSVRERWSCSPLQAMQALAELTSLEPAPETNVRLKRSVLDKTVSRDDISNKLVRAAQLGAFNHETQEKKWSGANLHHRKEAEDALEHARKAKELLPDLQKRFTEIADHAQIRVGENFAAWADQLHLLAEVRTVLDHFQPDIFERNVNDLIRATATSQWRREAGVEIPSGIRSRLRKVARAYIRPGVQVDDLHTRLIQVERLRESWNSYALTKRNPSVPLGIAGVQSLYTQTNAHLQELAKVLRPNANGQTIVEMPYEQLQSFIEELVEDEKTLFEVPELNLITEQLNETGLEELLADLRKRGVEVDFVADELELSWWKSALEAMISGDDYLAMVGGSDLRKIEAEFQLADQAHIQSGAARVAYQLSQRWRRALAEHINEASALRSGLKEHDFDLAGLLALPASLQTALIPIVVASPLGLAAHMGNGKKFDTVIFLDAGELTLAAALGGINRADQVVIFGDNHSADPKPFTVSVDPTATTRSVEDLTSLFKATQKILPAHALTTQYRAIDSALMKSLDSQIYQNGVHKLPSLADLTGEGSPMRLHRVVESRAPLRANHALTNAKTSHREVAAVVNCIFHHVKTRPKESLAVIAGTESHARAIAEGVKRQLKEERALADFFKGGFEPFAVAPLRRSSGLVRDHVIFSLGLNASGNEYNPSKGFFASDKAKDLVATALLSGRKNLDVFTSITPEMVSEMELNGGLATLFGVLSAPKLGVSSQRQAPAPLLDDLYQRLAQHDLNVLRDYGDQLTAVVEYKPNPLTDQSAMDIHSTPVAVMTDGDASFATMSVRERSRLRPLRLKGHGWKPFTIWTIEVFSDPAKLAERIYTLSTDGVPRHQQAPSDSPKDAGKRGRRAKFQFTDGILPTTAAEDQPHRWGDQEGSRDQWLKDQRPPHWN